MRRYRPRSSLERTTPRLTRLSLRSFWVWVFNFNACAYAFPLACRLWALDASGMGTWGPSGNPPPSPGTGDCACVQGAGAGVVMCLETLDVAVPFFCVSVAMGRPCARRWRREGGRGESEECTGDPQRRRPPCAKASGVSPRADPPEHMPQAHGVWQCSAARIRWSGAPLCWSRPVMPWPRGSPDLHKGRQTSTPHSPRRDQRPWHTPSPAPEPLADSGDQHTQSLSHCGACARGGHPPNFAVRG